MVPLASVSDTTDTKTRRPWRTPRLPELVGSAEAIEILGIQKSTLRRWMLPGSGRLGPDRTRMIPPVRVSSGPIWVREDVERFMREIGRERAYNPRGAQAPSDDSLVS